MSEEPRMPERADPGRRLFSLLSLSPSLPPLSSHISPPTLLPLYAFILLWTVIGGHGSSDNKRP